MPNKQLHLPLLASIELTPQEKIILESLCIGKLAKEIEHENGISTRGFYSYSNKIKIKLGAKTKEHAVAIYTLQNPELVKQLLERVR